MNKDYIQGKATIHTYTKSLIFTICVLFSTIIFAILLYEGGFDIGRKQISELDDIHNNPIGLWIFKFGFIFSGLWFAPNAINIAHRLIAFNKILGRIAGVFYVLSGFGMIIVAFFPVRVSYPMHIVGAIVGFGFLILGILLCFVLLFVKLYRNFNWSILLIGLIFYGPFFIVVVLALINAGLPLLDSLAQGIPFGQFIPIGWEYYEWGAFFTGLFSTLGTHFLYID